MRLSIPRNIRRMLPASELRQTIAHVKAILRSWGINKVNVVTGPGDISMASVYDGRILKRELQKKGDAQKAVMGEITSKCQLRTFKCIYLRKEWNPLSKFYVEPLGEKLGKFLSGTFFTPNGITFINIIFSLLAIGLLFFGSIGSIFFGIWVRFFHMIDIVDGMIARWACKGSLFGRWFDGAADRVVVSFWYIGISVALHLSTGELWPLYVGLLVLSGSLIYHYLMLTSVAYFRGNDFTAREEGTLRTNLFSKFVLMFLAHDIQMHVLTILALLGRLDIFLIFYAIYFNVISLAYFGYYYAQYLRFGDVKGS